MLSLRKGVDWLLDQWALWRASGDGLSDSLLLLAGPPSGEDAGKLQARVTRLTADPAAGVRWLGAVERVEEVYAAGDLLVLPSVAEGMSNVLQEAMSSGLPTAAAESSGCRDLLQGPPTLGWLFAPGDGAALRACLADLGAVERLRQMGVEARRRVETLFSIAAIAAQYEAAYRRLAG
jgi:glycosyltransferase involved in cell wall biosynthesis